MLNKIGIGNIIIWGVIIICEIVMIVHYMKSDKPSRTALKGMLSGTAVLVSINLWGSYIGLNIAINFFTVAIALTLGAPAIIIISLIEKFLC